MESTITLLLDQLERYQKATVEFMSLLSLNEQGGIEYIAEKKYSEDEARKFLQDYENKVPSALEANVKAKDGDPVAVNVITAAKCFRLLDNIRSEYNVAKELLDNLKKLILTLKKAEENSLTNKQSLLFKRALEEFVLPPNIKNNDDDEEIYQYLNESLATKLKERVNAIEITEKLLEKAKVFEQQQFGDLSKQRWKCKT